MPRKEGQTYGIDLIKESGCNEFISIFTDAAKIDRRFASFSTDLEDLRDHEELAGAAETAASEIRAAIAKFQSRIISLGFGH